LDPYFKLCNNNTELFSNLDPDSIFESIEDWATKLGLLISKANNKYKIKLTLPVSEVQKEETKSIDEDIEVEKDVI